MIHQTEICQIWARWPGLIKIQNKVTIIIIIIIIIIELETEKMLKMFFFLLLIFVVVVNQAFKIRKMWSMY